MLESILFFLFGFLFVGEGELGILKLTYSCKNNCICWKNSIS